MQQKTFKTLLALALSLVCASMQAAVSTCGVQSPCNAVVCAQVVKTEKLMTDVLVVRQSCGGCHSITAKDFMDAEGNLSQTFVIDQPGKWCLGENIVFNPAEPGTPAIQILSSDVYLDLCNGTLSQVDKSVSDTYGVQIGEGYNYSDPNAVLSNVTITNGSIVDFSAIGVFCYNGSFDGPVEEGFEQIAFKSLTFTDLNILGCGSNPSFDYGNGLNLDSVASIPNFIVTSEDPVAYSGLIIRNCKVNRCTGTAAINIYTYDNLVLEDTQANDFTTEISGQGFTTAYGITGRNLQMARCQGNNVQDLDLSGTSASAAALMGQSLNLYIRDCQFNDAFGETDFIVGSQFNVVQNVVFENCQFNNSLGGSDALLVNGLHMSDFAFQTTQGNGIKCINCQFNGVKGSAESAREGGLVAGVFVTSVRNVVFEDCQSSNIAAQSPVHDAFAFWVEVNSSDPFPEFGNVRNVTLTNCVASDISASEGSAGGFFSAYLDTTRNGEQAHTSNVVITNCIAERVSAGTSTDRCGGIVVGIDRSLQGRQYANGRNVFINDCRVSDVHCTLDEVSPLSAGIVVNATSNPVLKNNSISDCDRGVLFTGSDLITPDTLFQLAETFTGATAYTPVPVDLTSIPSPTPLQLFINQTRPTPAVVISPSTSSINLARNYLFSQTDLNTLGWQLGDAILYDNNGGADIGGLVDDQIYYLIVYVPGFAENGVVINNTVDNCSVSGYQDDLTPTTSSAWVNNFAFNNGTPASANTNYEIVWAGSVPVDAGNLAAYPTGAQKAYNISLIP